MNAEKLYLEGDLCQMSNQKRFLNDRGIRTEQSNVYPMVLGDDIYKSLRMIWEQSCDGWWHYENKYVSLGICTPDEFRNKLKRS